MTLTRDDLEGMGLRDLYRLFRLTVDVIGKRYGNIDDGSGEYGILGNYPAATLPAEAEGWFRKEDYPT